MLQESGAIGTLKKPLTCSIHPDPAVDNTCGLNDGPYLRERAGRTMTQESKLKYRSIGFAKKIKKQTGK